MDLSELLEKARKNTKVIRRRKNSLFTFGTTRLPYIFIADSEINQGDAILRRGEVIADKPDIIMPGHNPTFEGFEFLEELKEVQSSDINMVFMSRSVRFPNLKYTNTDHSLSVVDGPVDRAVEKCMNELEKENDNRTAVITGLAESASFSVLFYVGEMVISSAESNFTEWIEHHNAK